MVVHVYAFNFKYDKHNTNKCTYRVCLWMKMVFLVKALSINSNVTTKYPIYSINITLHCLGEKHKNKAYLWNNRKLIPRCTQFVYFWHYR